MFEWNKNELQRTWTTFTLSIVVAVIVCFLDITTHRKCFGHSFATYWSSDSILWIDLKLFSNTLWYKAFGWCRYWGTTRASSRRQKGVRCTLLLSTRHLYTEAVKKKTIPNFIACTLLVWRGYLRFANTVPLTLVGCITLLQVPSLSSRWLLSHKNASAALKLRPSTTENHYLIFVFQN